METKILLVDDNEDLLKISQLILKSQGYDTDIASTIEDAEQKIIQQLPSLLLLDVNICNEDGRAFCSRLKQQTETQNIKVVLMSGYDYSEAEWNGADDFLQKPF